MPVIDALISHQNSTFAPRGLVKLTKILCNLPKNETQVNKTIHCNQLDFRPVFDYFLSASE